MMNVGLHRYSTFKNKNNVERQPPPMSVGLHRYSTLLMNHAECRPPLVFDVMSVDLHRYLTLLMNHAEHRHPPVFDVFCEFLRSSQKFCPSFHHKGKWKTHREYDRDGVAPTYPVEAGIQ
ncbi:hypothetical protein HAX54_044297, partial [Datura stramonium]|nr:hypothetical protein [Datura stramonium]